MLDFVDLDAIALEHPLIVGRMRLQIDQSFVQQAFLIGLNLFYGLVFYVVVDHRSKFELKLDFGKPF